MSQAQADLAGATEEQAGNSLLDVSMAEDVGRHLAEDVLMQVGLCCKGLEGGLLLHPACTPTPKTCATSSVIQGVVQMVMRTFSSSQDAHDHESCDHV